ncbi:hypothetical protein amrb99_32490 [Actinomadura sp. RB99]|nr:hypothetical protein [Actinomadura sp. RB99]
MTPPARALIGVAARLDELEPLPARDEDGR